MRFPRTTQARLLKEWMDAGHQKPSLGHMNWSSEDLTSIWKLCMVNNCPLCCPQDEHPRRCDLKQHIHCFSTNVAKNLGCSLYPQLYLTVGFVHNWHKRKVLRISSLTTHFVYSRHSGNSVTPQHHPGKAAWLTEKQPNLSSLGWATAGTAPRCAEGRRGPRAQTGKWLYLRILVTPLPDTANLGKPLKLPELQFPNWKNGINNIPIDSYGDYTWEDVHISQERK